MSFVSYAQNFEDVMLWRVLKHVEHGFYIDIGAWSPDMHSVTRAFYERGWRGINIEPNPEFNRQLQERRPRDMNLRMAVGDREGILTMNILGNPGLSTLDDTIAEKHQQAGWNMDRQEVQVSTLAAIWEHHVSAGQDVHFLKVDVEGFEEAALRGNDWFRYRPWIVVVEATLPMSQVESHESWEPILVNANYRFAYADGLNRFYIADEHQNLLPAFKYPPNVFDDFLLGQQQVAEARATQAEARATQAEARATQAEVTLNAIYTSRSWRITAPLRWITIQNRQLREYGLKARVTAFARKIGLPTLRKMTHFITARSWLRQSLVTLTIKVGIYNELRSLYHRMQRTPRYRYPGESFTQNYAVPASLEQLTPRARQIHADLKTAIERRQKENG